MLRRPGAPAAIRGFGPPVINRSSPQLRGLRWWMPMTFQVSGVTGSTTRGTPRYFYGHPAWNENDYSQLGGNPTLRLDDMGPSYTFAGTPDAFVHGTTGITDTPGVLPANAQHATLTAWVRPSSLAAYRGIVGSRGGSALNLLLSGAAGNPFTYHWQDTGTDYDAATGLTLTVDRWHFVSASIWPNATLLTTWDHVNGLRTYRDTQAHAAKTLDASMAVGRDPGGGYWSGGITDVRIYDRPLEVAELLAMATSARWDLYAPTRRLWMDVVAAGGGGGGPVVGAGTLAGFLAATAREEIILCELDPVFLLTGFSAAGGGFANTYSVALSRFVQTTQVPGGMFAKCIRVTANGIALTERASIALVDANAGSWYWDEAAGTLYVRPFTGTPADFTMLATRRLYLASAPVVLEQTAGSPNTGIYYLPWLTTELPQVRRQVEDLLSGNTTFPSGSVSFLNGHRAWFTLVAGDGQWSWKYIPARFYLGGRYNGRSLARADYAPIATMLVEDVAPTETACAFELLPLRKLTELELPITPIFETSYPNLGDGVRGTKKWIGYGRAIIKPDLTDTATSQGVYTIADATYQTLFALHSVWAIRKDTGAWTLLTETTHYTKDLTACTVTIVSASFPRADYEIAVDVSGKPDGAGSYLKKYGEILRDMLVTFVGVAAADIDSAAFTEVALEADAEIALWVKDTRSLASIFASSEPQHPSLGRSVMGTLQQTAIGQWTVRVWDPSIDTITTTLRKEDLAHFAAKPKLKTVFSGVRVYYGFNHAKQQWSVVEQTDPTIEYKTGSRDRLELFTYLTTESNARTIAQRYLLLAGSVTVEAEFEERGALLAQMNAGDKVYVTYTPAPNAAGAYVSQPFEVLDLVVRYAPKVTVSGVLGDLRGLGGRVGRWVDSSAPDWATATTEQRLASGFWADANGRVDPGDPLSANRSIWW